LWDSGDDNSNGEISGSNDSVVMAVVVEVGSTGCGGDDSDINYGGGSGIVVGDGGDNDDGVMVVKW